MIRRKRNVEMGFYNETGFHPIRESRDYDDVRAGEGHKLPTSSRLRRVSKALKKRIGLKKKSNPARPRRTAKRNPIPKSATVTAAELKRLEAVTRLLRSRTKNALTKRNPVGWFRDVSPVTPEAIKKLYRKLAAKYHPDKGGDTRTMQEINSDYDKAIKIAAANEGNEHRAEAERKAAKPLREAIEFAVTLPDNVDVVIRGLWLWLQGNTYASRDRIKSFVASDGKRFKWAPKKKAWFFAAVPSSNRRGEMSFEDIDALHGRELVSERRRRLALNPKRKRNAVAAMHPIAAAAAGLSAVSTALTIRRQLKVGRTKKASRRTVSKQRKRNGTTSAKRRNPVSRSATLARCRKLVAADKRSTRKHVREIPITYHRRVSNSRTVMTADGPATYRGRPKFYVGDSVKVKAKMLDGSTKEYSGRVQGMYYDRGWHYRISGVDRGPAGQDMYFPQRLVKKANPRRLRKVAGMKGRSRRTLPRITRRKVNRNPVQRRRTFEMFQGRPATTAKAMPVSHFYAGKNLDTLGDLVELKLHSGRLLKFNPSRAKLCAAGGKLIIAGAKIAKPNPAGLANGIDAIDAIDHVVYRTHKPHHGDSPNTHYIHKLGEETGHMPLLCADKQGFPVIRGGRYKIEARGIVN